MCSTYSLFSSQRPQTPPRILHPVKHRPTYNCFCQNLQLDGARSTWLLQPPRRRHCPATVSPSFMPIAPAAPPPLNSQAPCTRLPICPKPSPPSNALFIVFPLSALMLKPFFSQKAGQGWRAETLCGGRQEEGWVGVTGWVGGDLLGRAAWGELACTQVDQMGQCYREKRRAGNVQGG